MCEYCVSFSTLYTTTTQRNVLSGGEACHHLDGSVALPTLHLRFAGVLASL